ncbi:MAG: GTP-binding protein, partial [Alphaproteobacteria bacterium]|nr:GTP-binding protein [Alphaproteobacteria bacterium]
RDSTRNGTAGGGSSEWTTGRGRCPVGAERGPPTHGLATQSPPPDGIILEARGIADPVGLATIVAAQGRARLDGVVAVVDAGALDSWLDNPATQPLFQRQLDAAHLLVMNKADLAGAGMIVAATARLGALAPGRPVITTEQGRLDAHVALGAALRGARTAPLDQPHDSGAFATRTIAFSAPIDRQDLVAFLENPPAGLLRVKGFVELRGEPGRVHMAQAVGRMWSIEPLREAPRPTQPANGLVLIGLAASAGIWLQAPALRAKE